MNYSEKHLGSLAFSGKNKRRFLQWYAVASGAISCLVTLAEILVELKR
jgi:hypothetical protein